MRVFVYGTLKKGFSNSYLLRNARYIGTATTRDSYDMIDVGFPVLLTPKPGGGYRVAGEVYEIDAATAEALDQLESRGFMYDRVRKYVEMEDGSKVRLYYYVGCARHWKARAKYLRGSVPIPVYDWNQRSRAHRTFQAPPPYWAV